MGSIRIIVCKVIIRNAEECISFYSRFCLAFCQRPGEIKRKPRKAGSLSRDQYGLLDPKDPY